MKEKFRSTTCKINFMQLYILFVLLANFIMSFLFWCAQITKSVTITNKIDSLRWLVVLTLQVIYVNSDIV